MAGRSPASKSSRARCATSGDLPRPPVARLPTEIEGTEISNGPSSAAERPDDAAAAGWREQRLDRGHSARFGPAVGFDEGARRGAEAGALDGIAGQPHDRLDEPGRILDLDRSLLREERRRDLREV